MSRATKMISSFFIGAMFWLGLFIATDSSLEFQKIHNIIVGLPSYFLISFGCYALFEIGKGLANLNDCPEEYNRNLADIKRAKDFLGFKGFFNE